MLFQNTILLLLHAVRRFWEIFDIARTFYKTLENASKILHALQNDYSMEVFRKLFDSLCKKSMNFLCSLQNFSQVFVLHLSKKNLKVRRLFGGFKQLFFETPKN